jgi:NADP-dependent 3-hydroxy acid dehydrogenase YdfG
MEKKVAVITGASKGIGRACAELFLKEGYVVIDASRSNSDPIKNDNWLHIKTDVSNEADIENLFNEVKDKYGRIDVLINNAGYGKFKKLAETKTQDYDNMFSVNVRGLYLCTRYFLQMMLEQKSGTIINIASLAGKNGFATGTLYCATKPAVMGLSRALMLEVRSSNIRVIAVCPGSVDTEFFVDSGTTPNNDPKTFLTSEDVAKACLLAAELPLSAAMNEIELRPTNPHS